MEDTQVELCTVTQGKVAMSVVGSDSARRLSQALEKADPWGSIPFIHRRTCSHTEALEAIQSMGVLNTIKLVKELEDV